MTQWSEERKRAQSDRMKKRWAENPVFAAKVRTSLAWQTAKRFSDPKTREKTLKQLLWQRCSPSFHNYRHIRLRDPRQAEIHRQICKMLHTDPVLIEKRRAALKLKWADPEYRARMAEKNRRTADKRRGFRVPKDKWDDYQQLIRSKIPAHEAGQILGLI